MRLCLHRDQVAHDGLDVEQIGDPLLNHRRAADHTAGRVVLHRQRLLYDVEDVVHDEADAAAAIRIDHDLHRVPEYRIAAVQKRGEVDQGHDLAAILHYVTTAGALDQRRGELLE